MDRELRLLERVSDIRVCELLKSRAYISGKPQEDLRAFCTILEFFSGGGSIERHYKPAEDAEDGRLYSGGGLQTMRKELRGYLCQDDYVDIDIVNCHPTILLQMMKEQDYKAKYLKDYCDNRDVWIEKFENIKKHVLCQINDNTLYMAKDAKVAKLYKEIFKFCERYNGKVHRELFKRENEIIQKVLVLAQKHKIDINAIVFDGMIVKKSKSIEKFIEAVNRAISPYQVAKKEWTLPSDLSIIETERFDYTDFVTFTDLLKLTGRKYKSKNEFYMEALPLLLKTCRVVNGNLITKNYLSPIYESFVVSKSIKRDEFCVTIEGEKNNTNLFFSHLITAFGRLIMYNSLTPLRRVQNKQEFSVDCGFLCDNIPLPHDWKERLEPFKRHIREVNASENEVIERAFYYYYANIIQTEKQSQIIMITTGSQGSGKSIIPTMIANKILGNKALIVSTLNDVIGKFNSQLCGKRMVLINEMSNVDSNQKHNDNDILKNIIDAPYFLLEKKGVDRIKIPNILEFIGCSNHANCISQCDGMERRNFVVQASDKYKQNGAYFDSLIRYFDDEKNIKSIFEFLMTYDISDTHFLKNLPMTYNKAVGIWKSMHPAIKASMIAILLNHGKEVKISRKQLHQIFIKYKLSNNEKMNSLRLAEYLKNKVRMTKSQNKMRFHVCKKSLVYDDEVWKIAQEHIENIRELDAETSASSESYM